MGYDGPIQVLAIWGKNKTCKTTLALTGPKKLVHFDFDLGFRRAAPRFRPDIDNKDIASKTYAVPMQLRSPRVFGVREVWEEFQADFLKAIQDTEVTTVAVDTHTQLWEVCRLGYLQEKQEAQFDVNGNLKKTMNEGGQQYEVHLREKLLPIEYGEPNSRMRSIIYAARSAGKVLIITHYARDQYQKVLKSQGLVEETTGQLEADAWKFTEGLCDVMVKTEVKDSKPIATVTLSGVSLSMVGMEIIEPTFEKLDQAVAMTTGG